ncbi:MAG: dehydrogenase [Candidatus Lokiarchaeota archaeon]|nr:dehydrogenase [Candidatus Lokiarchaeota archaeon]
MKGFEIDEELVGSFKVKKFPTMRNLVTDLMWTASKKNIVHGIGEVDVSKPRNLLKEMKEKTGKTHSFTSFIIYCLAQAVDKHKYMQAIRKGKKLYIFDDVDVSTIVEREVDGRKFPMTHIVRKANEKTLAEITEEIRTKKQTDPKEEDEHETRVWFAGLPKLFRRWYWKKVYKDPRLEKQMGGTVGVTAIGMFSEGAGWAIPITPKPLTIVVGGISERPVRAKDGGVDWHEHLCLTFSIDHDLVDGAPATRFINDFCYLIMNGAGIK